MFIWEMLWIVIVSVGAALGLVVGLCSRPARWPVALLLLLASYHVVTIGVVGLDAYSRHRSSLVPFASLFAAVGVVLIGDRLRDRNAFAAKQS